MVDRDSKENLVAALLGSGFPFQTAIAELAEEVPNCGIAAEEFPWRDDSGKDEFLDLIVSCFNFAVAIECKKAQRSLIFLQPSTQLQRNVHHARCSFVSQMRDSTMRLILYSGEWELAPESPEAAFCVVSTDSGTERLLEKDAQLLIRGADAFGKSILKSRPRALGEPDRILVPVIVTNAKLYQAIYDPHSISLESGQLPIPPVPEISELRWIRFRKPFIAASRDAGERTVFVVSATSFQDFLRELQGRAQPSPPERVITLDNNL
jgi:hypothetical protein